MNGEHHEVHESHNFLKKAKLSVKAQSQLILKWFNQLQGFQMLNYFSQNFKKAKKIPKNAFQSFNQFHSQLIFDRLNLLQGYQMLCFLL